MSERRWWLVLTGLAVVIVGLIGIASAIDIPGVSKFVRPVERGTGTKCAEGNADACREICHALAEVSSLKCGAPVVHPIHRRGGGNSTGNPHPPGSSPGSGPSPAPPSSPPQPPVTPPPPVPPPTTTTPRPPPPPPTLPPPVRGLVHMLCHLDLLGHRICVEVR